MDVKMTVLDDHNVLNVCTTKLVRDKMKCILILLVLLLFSCNRYEECLEEIAPMKIGDVVILKSDTTKTFVISDLQKFLDGHKFILIDSKLSPHPYYPRTVKAIFKRKK